MLMTLRKHERHIVNQALDTMTAAILITQQLQGNLSYWACTFIHKTWINHT